MPFEMPMQMYPPAFMEAHDGGIKGAGKCSKTTRKMHEKTVKIHEHAGKSMILAGFRIEKNKFCWSRRVDSDPNGGVRSEASTLSKRILHFTASTLLHIYIYVYMYTSENSIGESCTAPKNIRNCPGIASRKTTGYPLSWLFQKYGV